MPTALLTGLAGTAIGAVLGIWTRSILATLNYRLDDEQDLPVPGKRWWIIWTAALSLGSIAAWLAGTNSWALAPVLLPLTLTGPALAAIDLDVMRLPNRILEPVAAVAVAGLSTTLTSGTWIVPTQAIVSAMLSGGALLLLSVLSRGGVGAGDVKLGSLVGLAAGAVAPAAAWWALLVASVFAFGWSRSLRPAGPLAFGPWLLLGAWTAVLSSAW